MRDASTYRSERRNRWRRAGTSWANFNAGLGRLDAWFGVGTRPTRYQPPRAARSKYMPHTGKKQRAKGVVLAAAAQ